MFTNEVQRVFYMANLCRHKKTTPQKPAQKRQVYAQLSYKVGAFRLF